MYLFLFFLLSPVYQVFSDTDDETFIEYLETTPKMHPPYSHAFIEVFGSNIALSLFNRYALKADYAMVNRESVRTNMRSGWVWDQDEFSVNHIGHPYQGSYYYIAGRSHGMGFWSSTALTLMGSHFWELFMETELPSKNDLIVTTMGGAALGEMLHRLYVEADRLDFGLKWILSPLDDFNELINGEFEPDSTYHRINTAETSFFTGIGLAKDFPDEQRGVESALFRPAISTGGTVVYGNPYGLRTKTPFEHFEQRIGLQYALPYYYSVRFFSDGFLWAFPLLDTPVSRSTLGIGLHYDFLFESLVNLFSNAIGVSYKMYRVFSNKVRWSIKAHAHYIFLGGSEFIPLWYGDAAYSNPEEEHRKYDIGIGEGVKLYTYLAHPQWGALRFNAAFYGFHVFPATIPENGSPGYSAIGIFTLAYEQQLFKTWALGIGAQLYYKRGFYDTAADVEEALTSYTIYLKKRFRDT
jgi:hypothetical protein